MIIVIIIIIIIIIIVKLTINSVLIWIECI